MTLTSNSCATLVRQAYLEKRQDRFLLLLCTRHGTRLSGYDLRRIALQALLGRSMPHLQEALLTEAR